MPKISLPDSYKFRRVFFDRCSWWRKRRWNSLYGHFSRKNTPLHASTGARAANQHASIGSAARDSLGKNVSKEVCFWLWGNDNLVQLFKRTSVTWTVDIVCFSGAAMEFLKCFVDERFINKAQFDAGFAHGLILKDGAVPAIKSRSWFRTADGEWNGIKCLCFVGDHRKCSSLFSSAHDTPSLFSSAHTTRLQELGFFRRES